MLVHSNITVKTINTRRTKLGILNAWYTWQVIVNNANRAKRVRRASARSRIPSAIGFPGLLDFMSAARVGTRKIFSQRSQDLLTVAGCVLRVLFLREI